MQQALTEPRTANFARKLWAAANREDTVVSAHPYAIRKGIKNACGAGRGAVTGKLVGTDADCIIVPMRTLAGDLIGVECINPDGIKQAFGSKGILILGNDLDPRLTIVVIEAMEDGTTIHTAVQFKSHPIKPAPSAPDQRKWLRSTQ